jgi:hypothetical protein
VQLPLALLGVQIRPPLLPVLLAGAPRSKDGLAELPRPAQDEVESRSAWQGGRFQAQR